MAKNNSVEPIQFWQEMNQALATTPTTRFLRPFHKEALMGSGKLTQKQTARVNVLAAALDSDDVEAAMFDIGWATAWKISPAVSSSTYHRELIYPEVRNALLNEAVQRGMLELTPATERLVTTSNIDAEVALKPLSRMDETNPEDKSEEQAAILSLLNGLRDDFMAALTLLERTICVIYLMRFCMTNRQMCLLPEQDYALLKQPLPTELETRMKAEGIASKAAGFVFRERSSRPKEKEDATHIVMEARMHCGWLRHHQKEAAGD